MKLNNLKKLIMIANLLDQKGLFKEADALDQIIIKLSMPVRGYTDPIGEEPSDASTNLGKGMLNELTLLGRNIIWVPVNTDNLLTNPVEREKFFNLFGKSNSGVHNDAGYRDYSRNRSGFDIEKFKYQGGRLRDLILYPSVPIDDFLEEYPGLKTQVEDIIKSINLTKDDVVLYISNIAPYAYSGNVDINEYSETIRTDVRKSFEFQRDDPAWEAHDFFHGLELDEQYVNNFSNTMNVIINSYEPEEKNNETKIFFEKVHGGSQQGFALIRDFLKNIPGLFRAGSVTTDSLQDIYRYLALHGPEDLISNFTVPDRIRIPGSFARLKNAEKENKVTMRGHNLFFFASPSGKEAIQQSWKSDVMQAYEWITSLKNEEGESVGPYSEYEGQAVVAPGL